MILVGAKVTWVRCLIIDAQDRLAVNCVSFLFDLKYASEFGQLYGDVWGLLLDLRPKLFDLEGSKECLSSFISCYYFCPLWYQASK